MWRNIVGQAVFQITVLVVFLFFGKTLFKYDYDEATTPFFILVNGGE
jgi:hypothetical protein